MSASLPSAGLLQRLLRVYAIQFAHTADEQNAAAASRHGRPRPAPVDVSRFEAKPLPIKVHADGSVSVDPSTEWGLVLAASTADESTRRDALFLAAARCIATAVVLIRKAGEP